jgi:hypothetical protein
MELARSRHFYTIASRLIDLVARAAIINAWPPATQKETAMSDLNNANPTPPEDVKAKLEKAAEESKKLDSPKRTNDSTIDPAKPKEDILKGFHGG